MATRSRADSEAVARRLALLSAELTGGPVPDDRPPPTRVRPAASGGPGVPAPPPPPSALPVPRGAPVPPARAHVGLEILHDSDPIPVPGRHARRRPLGVWGSRFELFPGPVAVVAIVVALGVTLTAWWLVRARPDPVPGPTPVAAGLATPLAAVAAGSDTGSVPADVVVHVAGRVRKAGVITLPAGSRVADALTAAGGARRGVDLATINLARPLVDGEQLLVGVKGSQPGAEAVPGAVPGSVPGAGPATSGLVNLNTADAAVLDQLPGVGPVTAAAIVAFRDEHGAFTSVDQLLDVSGIGEKTLAEIAPHATV